MIQIKINSEESKAKKRKKIEEKSADKLEDEENFSQFLDVSKQTIYLLPIKQSIYLFFLLFVWFISYFYLNFYFFFVCLLESFFFGLMELSMDDSTLNEEIFCIKDGSFYSHSFFLLNVCCIFFLIVTEMTVCIGVGWCMKMFDLFSTVYFSVGKLFGIWLWCYVFFFPFGFNHFDQF